jgi:hypothetical protein
MRAMTDRNKGRANMVLCPFRAKNTLFSPFPRALPWAVMFCPFGAFERNVGYAQFIFFWSAVEIAETRSS